MRKPVLQFAAISLLAALVTSCRTTEDGAALKPAPLPPGVKEMSLAVTRNRMTGGESNTESVDVMPSPSLEQIEKQIRDVDWHDTNLRVSVGLGKVDAAGNHSMKVQRLDGAPGLGGVKVTWLAVEGGKVAARQTDIDSIDEAAAMMRAFHQGDPGLAEKAHWDAMPP